MVSYNKNYIFLINSVAPPLFKYATFKSLTKRQFLLSVLNSHNLVTPIAVIFLF